jgi:hypothetical protein
MTNKGACAELCIRIRFIVRVAGCAAALFGLLCIVAPEVAKADVTRECISPSADLGDMTVFNPSDRQRRQLADAYADPSVVGFKQAVERYLLRVPDEETAVSLKGISRDLLSDRVSIFSAERFPGGGESLLLPFNHHPNAVYFAWMYHLAGGPWVVRSFSKTACSSQQLRWLLHRYGSVFPF